MSPHSGTAAATTRALHAISHSATHALNFNAPAAPRAGDPSGIRVRILVTTQLGPSVTAEWPGLLTCCPEDHPSSAQTLHYLSKVKQDGAIINTRPFLIFYSPRASSCRLSGLVFVWSAQSRLGQVRLGSVLSDASLYL